MILYALAASGLVLLGAVVLFLAFAARGESSDVPAAMRAAGCSYQTFESEGRNHVGSLDARVDYKTFPPTSGPHYVIPAVWDIYDRPINQVQSVHNLEHGGILIQYGDEVPQSAVDRIAEFYREDPNGMLVAPLPGLGDQIALTAWRHLAKGNTFDEEVFDTFVEEFGFKGPESCKSDLDQGCFRRSDMPPGNP
jgi:hypothetical protein